MSENAPQKASPEDIAKLRALAENWEALTKRFGELHYQKKLVEIELKQVDAALDDLENERQAVVTTLQQQFGSAGAIDLTTGDFIPDTP